MIKFSKSKQLVAKILAEENIKTVQTNTKTAYFNVATRVLCMPYWKDDNENPYSTAVCDMLTAHEVSHALHTPIEGIHTYNEDKEYRGIPFSILNIVEDARIERLIKHKYTYFILVFNNAYKEIWDRKVKHVIGDPRKRLLIDRINFYYKFYPVLKESIRFEEIIKTPEEESVIRMIDRADEFEDVLRISKIIRDMMKEELEKQKQEEEQQEQEKSDNQEQQEDDSQDQQEQQDQSDNKEPEEDQNSEEESEEESESQDGNEETEGSEDDDSDDQTESDSGGDEGDEDESQNEDSDGGDGEQDSEGPQPDEEDDSNSEAGGTPDNEGDDDDKSEEETQGDDDDNSDYDDGDSENEAEAEFQPGSGLDHNFDDENEDIDYSQTVNFERELEDVMEEISDYDEECISVDPYDFTNDEDINTIFEEF